MMAGQRKVKNLSKKNVEEKQNIQDKNSIDYLFPDFQHIKIK